MSQPDHYVLVLDDNITMIRESQEIWNRHNVELVSAQTVEDAVELLRSRQFSLIAVSAGYLDDKTLDVVRFLRSVSLEPIMVLTSEDDKIQKISVLEWGADAVMIVPETLEEGVATGWALIRRYTDLNKKTDMGDVLYRGKLILYTDSRRAFVNGKEVVLTRLEFEILRLLMEGDGRVFSYDDIFRSVWGDPYAGTDKTVLWSHIRKIRKKLSEDEDVGDYIKNVHSVGYKFVVNQ